MQLFWHTHTVDSMQRILDALINIYHSLGLQVNTMKTKVLVYQRNPEEDIPQFYINNTQLQVVPTFKYLGNIITPTNNIGDDVIERISKASRSFGRLRLDIRR